MNKILTKIFGDAGVGIVDKLAGVADRFIRTKDEKAKFQKEMEQIWIQAESDMQKNVTERWMFLLTVLILQGIQVFLKVN